MGDSGGATRVFCESERDVREEIVRKRGDRKKKEKKKKKVLSVRVRFRFFFNKQSGGSGIHPIKIIKLVARPKPVKKIK